MGKIFRKNYIILANFSQYAENVGISTFLKDKRWKGYNIKWENIITISDFFNKILFIYEIFRKTL